ncbi:MAG: dTMP kinase [Candidatus Margulisbacteria bacterium]|nr:dTMP kinase [Candidatus Margulisiibacteriota bacterium]
MEGKSLFISLEGIEGSGKTTQIKKLASYLSKQGVSTLMTHEPGGTPLGKSLRKLVLDHQTPLKNTHSEILLFIADRLEHVDAVIKPALDAGKVVLCDRFVDSTVAYQQGGRQLPESLVSYLNGLVSIRPHMTILLDISPEEGLRRARERSALDRFEKETIDFHQRVRQMYLSLSEKEPHRIKCISIDTLSPEEVFEKLRPLIDALI